MYVNPWKYEVGDLVKTADEWTGVIVDRRRKEAYVEARPIRCIEIDEYCVVINDTKHWLTEENLELSQTGYPAAAGAELKPLGTVHE